MPSSTNEKWKSQNPNSISYCIKKDLPPVAALIEFSLKHVYQIYVPKLNFCKINKLKHQTAHTKNGSLKTQINYPSR